MSQCSSKLVWQLLLLLSAGHSSLWQRRQVAHLHALQNDSTSPAAFRIYCPFINYNVHFVGFKNIVRQEELGNGAS
jgi:hypothetical protein